MRQEHIRVKRVGKDEKDTGRPTTTRNKNPPHVPLDVLSFFDHDRVSHDGHQQYPFSTTAGSRKGHRRRVGILVEIVVKLHTEHMNRGLGEDLAAAIKAEAGNLKWAR
ncbi:unnamed protein product [Dovyalis caffra]|uniref:Uncharacterized protein n=1 Tax=Dovyalis caffra TaxID=77055 RepID=A0AAV1S7X6_9ROSI|nr:unnamed protein product [Dovyalis caffra]